MSGLIDSVNGTARRVFLSAATVGPDFIPRDFHHELKILRTTVQEYRRYYRFSRATGNDPAGPTNTPVITSLSGGTLICPYDTSHKLRIVGTLITDEGLAGSDCFDLSYLSQGTQFSIAYEPAPFGVVEVPVASAVLPDERTALLQTAALANQIFALTQQVAALQQEMKQTEGLDKDNPLTVDRNNGIIRSGDIEIQVSSENGIETYERQ